MFGMKPLALSVLAISLLTAQAEAQVSRYYKVAQSGHSLEVAYESALNPDCTSLGRVTINLLEAPANGEIKVGEGRRFATFPLTNSRSTCNRRRVPTTIVFYQSRPGYVGQDRFAIEAISPDGTAQRARLSVDVR